MSDQGNDQTPAPDQTGITRDQTGTITDGSTQTTTPDQTTQTTQTTEPKTILNQDDKTPVEKKDDKPTDKKDDKALVLTGAPKEYADYTVPDGWSLDPEAKKEIDGIAQKLNLSQDGAQLLVNEYSKRVLEAHDAPFKAYRDMVDSWLKEAQDHPDLKGKLGPGQEVNVTIGKFLSSLDPTLASEFRKTMDLTGAGNHPAFIRVLFHAAQKLTEGSHVAGSGPSKDGQSASGRTAQPTAAQAMYPNLKSAT